MSEGKLKAVIFLLVYWTSVIIFFHYFAPILSNVTDANTLNFVSINDDNMVSILWQFATFQIQGSKPFIISAILDGMLLISGVTTFLIIRGG